MTDAFCPACRRSSAAFEPVGDRPEARCLRCQAVERTRFSALLFDVLEPWLAHGRRRVLEVAPQSVLRKLLTGRFGIDHVGIDLLEDRPIDAWADLTRLPFADGAFDLAVCSHVLEHVPDDRAAMSELARVTATRGLVVIYVPYRPGQPTDEGPLAPGETAAERFGQDDHVRWYGDDLDDRLLAQGLRPLVLTPTDVLTLEEIERCRLVPDERVWLCTPTAAGALDADGPLGRLLAGRAADLRAADLLLRGPDDRLRDLAAIRRRADRSFDLEREAGELRRQRDAALARAEHAEAMYRRFAAHPVVRVVRAVRSRLRR